MCFLKVSHLSHWKKDIPFASEKGYIPIEIRLIAVALGGLALTQLGWKLRIKKPDYALPVQGGGIGLLFITTFASLKLYHIIPAPLAFLILVALALLTALMAIIQDSKSLAIFGIVGGFLAPVLASTGQGNHIILFSYYLLLNLGILAISWFKSWRSLNLLGFVFTFVISSAWGVLKYKTHQFWSVEPFLITFFLIYIAIPIIFAKKQRPELKGLVDGTLIFGNTILAFGLQTQLVKVYEYATAFSALSLAFFYISLAKWLYSKKDPNLKLLVEAFVSLGVVFATITIPLVFDGHWTAAVWAAEGAGVYWVSVRQERKWGRIFSSILIFLAGIAFMLHHQRSGFALPILNSFYFGCVVIALSSIFASYICHKNENKFGPDERIIMAPAFFIFGNLWWIVGGYVEIEGHFIFSLKSLAFSSSTLKNVSTIYVVLGLLFCSYLGRKLKWSYLTLTSFFAVDFMAILLLRVFTAGKHPFESLGYLVWPICFLSYYYILHNNEKNDDVNRTFVKFGHAGSLWTLAIVGSWELAWYTKKIILGGSGWGTAAYGIIPVALIFLVLLKSDKLKWPIVKHYEDYLRVNAVQLRDLIFTTEAFG